MPRTETIYRVQPVGLITPEIVQIRAALKDRLAGLNRIVESYDETFGSGPGRDADEWLARLKWDSIDEVRKAVTNCKRPLHKTSGF